MPFNVHLYPVEAPEGRNVNFWSGDSLIIKNSGPGSVYVQVGDPSSNDESFSTPSEQYGVGYPLAPGESVQVDGFCAVLNPSFGEIEQAYVSVICNGN